MSDVKWIKLRIDMFDDEKIKVIQNMPEGDAMLVIWIRLLTLAGKTNDGGYLYLSENLPYTDEMLSIILGKNISTIRLAMQTFEQLRMIENDVKGIYLVNFDKHQNLSKLEAIRDYNREKQKQSRERKKVGQKLSLTSQECQSTEQDKDKELEEEVDKELLQEEKSGGSGSLQLKDVFICYKNEIGLLSPTVKETFESYQAEITVELMILAIKTAVKSNARRLNYIEGILRNWVNDSIHTVDELKTKEIEKNSKPKYIPTTKVEKFNSMYSHDWDFDELEKLQREHITDKLKKEGKLSE